MPEPANRIPAGEGGPASLLPVDLQARIQMKNDRLGQRLDQFPHVAMKGCDAFRIRIGDYRVIYDFDLEKGVLYLLAVGHRREVYRN